MALDVKYLRGTKAQYEGYLANTNNPDYSGNQKIVDTTYYLIYEKSIGISTPGYPLLYIGKVLLSESAEIESILQKIDKIENDISVMSDDINTLKIDVDLLKNNGSNTSISIDKSLLPEDFQEKEVVVITDLKAEGHILTPTYSKAASIEYVDEAISSIAISIPSINIIKDNSVSDTIITIKDGEGEDAVEKETLGLVSILRDLSTDENNGHTLIETRIAVPTLDYVEKMIANITGGETAGEVLTQLENFKVEVSNTYATLDNLKNTNDNLANLEIRTENIENKLIDIEEGTVGEAISVASMEMKTYIDNALTWKDMS